MLSSSGPFVDLLLIVNPLGEGAVPLDSPPRVNGAWPKPTPSPAQQLRQLGEVAGQPPCLVHGEHASSARVVVILARRNRRVTVRWRR